MILTLIDTCTASNAAACSFTSGIDSTYDEYMFVMTDVSPATDATAFTVQFNAAGESGYNEDIHSCTFESSHNQGGTASFAYIDVDQERLSGDDPQIIATSVGNGADESCAGILQLFRPANTTYVKHFYSRMHGHRSTDYAETLFMNGWIDVATAIDDVQFKFASGNMDGVIQMYGVA